MSCTSGAAGPVWAPQTVSVVSGEGVLPSVDSRGASLNGSSYPSGSLPDPAQQPAANKAGMHCHDPDPYPRPKLYSEPDPPPLVPARHGPPAIPNLKHMARCQHS